MHEREIVDETPNQAGGLPEERRSRLGFDLDEEAWFARVREFSAGESLGRIGPYELLGEAGRGGQGVVYRARQPRTGRVIAIKRVSAGAFATPQMRARFQREVEAAAALNHPGIVTVFGSEVVDGQPVLAMEWIDGVPIDRWAAGEGGRGAGNAGPANRRSVQDVLGVFEQVCNAVNHAHQRGVIHRDLKPSNILIDQNNCAHVLDFGLAKLSTEPGGGTVLTLTGDFLGTPAYAAPEQARGRQADVDVRTDVYALGAVLYQALTGAAMFASSGDLGETLRMIQTRDPRAPSAVDERLNTEIDAIVLKAVAKEKEQRYASVDALRADVQRFLAGQTVLAHPPSTTYRLRKFVRQHRGAVSVGVAFVAVLVAASAVSTTAFLRAEAQRKRAEAALAAESEQRARAQEEQTRAEQEASRAQRESAKHEAVGSFIADMFQKADPGGQGGRADVTVREALDAATGKLADGATNYDAEVESSLRMAMGEIYSSLTLDEPAAAHFERALELRRQVFGDESESVAGTLNSLARVYRGRKPAEAEAAQRESLAIRRKLLPSDSPYLAQALSSLAITLRRNGKSADAEPLLREARDIYRKVFGEDGNVAHVTSSLCVTLIFLGRYDEAIDEGRRALEILRPTPDDRANPHIVNPLLNLAAAHWHRGDRAEAEALIQEAIGINRKCYPDPHGVTAHLEFTFAGWLAEMDRIDEAAALSESALNACRQLEREPSELHAKAQFGSAKIARRAGRLVEAEAEGAVALEMYRRVIPRGADEVALWLAEVREELGDFSGARDLILEMVTRERDPASPSWCEEEVQARLDAMADAR